jgi:DNA-binding MarR family transcriptional regulator
MSEAETEARAALRARAVTHPLREKILFALGEREASPSQLAHALDAPLGVVAYHVRVLAQLGMIRRVRRAPCRGSLASYYRAEPRP